MRANFANLSNSGTLCAFLVSNAVGLHLPKAKLEGFIDEAHRSCLAEQASIDCHSMSEKDIGIEAMPLPFILTWQ